MAQVKERIPRSKTRGKHQLQVHSWNTAARSAHRKQRQICRGCTRPRPVSRNSDGSGRQPVPLHRLRGYLPIRSTGAKTLMQGTITGRDLLEPRSLTDALKMLRDEGPLVPMAGCTDLYVSLNFGTLRPMRFLNLWNLHALRGIGARGATLRIGALATHTDIIKSALIRRRLPMLAAAAREVGGVQIQNRGTIGGNVANASPAGDTARLLAAMRSRATHCCRDASRPMSRSTTATARRSRALTKSLAFEIPS